jgi:hypothetical protein
MDKDGFLTRKVRDCELFEVEYEPALPRFGHSTGRYSEIRVIFIIIVWSFDFISWDYKWRDRQF